jgi:hypothetical protein
LRDALDQTLEVGRLQAVVDPSDATVAIETEACRVLDLTLTFSHPDAGGLRVSIAGTCIDHRADGPALS